jgi:hypothetical protein
MTSADEQEWTRTWPRWRGSRLDVAAVVSALIDVIGRDLEDEVLRKMPSRPICPERRAVPVELE